MYTQTENTITQSQNKKQEMRLIRYADALREAFEMEMLRDPKVFLFGLDVDVQPKGCKKNLAKTAYLERRFPKTL
jgi:pyruvate/2-oxoglutarate/acetoin dehydrogenase E1 component